MRTGIRYIGIFIEGLQKNSWIDLLKAFERERESERERERAREKECMGDHLASIKLTLKFQREKTGIRDID